MIRSLTIIVIGACLCGCAAPPVPEQQFRKNTGSMKLQIESPKNTFIVNESLTLTVRFTNEATAPMKVPQIADNRNAALTYKLKGPSAEDGYEFNYGSSADFVLPGDPEMVVLKSGSRLEELIDMVGYLPVWEPGEYSIVAQWEDIRSEPFVFTVEYPKALSAQVISDGWPINPGVMRIAFLTAAGDIYQGFYSETDGTDETPARSKFVHAGTAPADAVKSLTPLTNFDRASVFFSRFGWASEERIGFFEASADSSVSMETNGAAILGQALMREDGVVHLFTVNENQLSMFAVPRKNEGVPSMEWQLDLPFSLESGSSALGSPASGNQAGAAIVMNGNEGVILAAAINGELKTALFEELIILPDSQPALWIETDGTIRVSVIAESIEVANQIQLAEAVWYPGNPEAETNLGPKVEIMKEISGAAVAYAQGPSLLRRDWVVAVAGGKIVSSKAPSELRQFGTGPVMPIQIHARITESYVLVNNPKSVLYLNQLW